uniref:NAD-dependent epimerase/dehydratase n=1 Tax=Rhodopseudomonas palustris (strain BisA53) TaxID=316055 RepID=Q07KV9_RHOP5
MSKLILVCGGAGFLGSHLCDTLISGGDRVICLDNFQTGSRRNVRHLLEHPRFKVVTADVVDPVDFKVDRIYNLACPASPPRYQDDPIRTIRTSVLGALNLVALAERTGARLLQASTSEVYGDPELHPQTEEYRGNVSFVGPRACYDEGKRCAETVLFDAARAGRADVRVARIFNTYGPNMDVADGRVVSNFAVQALRNEPISVYGKGDQTRSFCYVTDLIDGLVRLMEHPGDLPGAVNLGNPNEMTVIELARLIIDLTGSRSRVVHLPLPKDDPTRRRPDIARAGRYLGWRPTTNLVEGLAMTIGYFEAELERSAMPTVMDVA